VEKILKLLNIQKINQGAWTGNPDWVQEVTEDTLKSYNPTNNEVIAEIIEGSEVDIEAILRGSVEAFNTWRQVPAPKRGELVREIAAELRRLKDPLGTLVSLECGKIKAEGDGEVQEMIDMADFAVGLSRMLYGKTMPSERPEHRMYEQWQPLGPVSVITSFNFPVAVWSWNAFIAAVCGDTVIWKPSSKTPLCAIAVQQICERVMQRLGYAGIFSLMVTADNNLAQQLVEDSRIPLVSFTGSTPVGRKLGETVAHRLAKSILELSGNNAVIIDESADLDLAIPAVVFGAVGTAGQRCTSIRRLFVHQSYYQQVLIKLAETYETIKIGDPLEAGILMGPLIDQKAVQDYAAAIDEVKNLNGKIIYGGKVLKRAGNFVEPTIVAAENGWDIVQKETFAPILYVMPFASIEEAIALQNASAHGLSSAIFTRNIHNEEYFLSALGSDCGIANVNIGTSGAEIGGAFGGEKATGGGREAGSDAWKAYMRRQTNTINWSTQLPLAQGIKFKF
jgi:aldehyde dehydrogenase (NAD+)